MFRSLIRRPTRLARHSRPVLVRCNSSFILRSPPPIAPRECPTPLVFVSSKAWDTDSDNGMSVFASMLSDKGFTCLQTDLALPSDSQVRNDSERMMDWFQNELRSSIRLSMIPFPPVIFARSAGCLIAQTYISSNPASGLFLMSPPSSNAELENMKAANRVLNLLPTKLAEFDFEPHFPVAVMALPERMKVLQQLNRLVREPDVDKLVVNDLEGQQALNSIENWLDKLGI